MPAEAGKPLSVLYLLQIRGRVQGVGYRDWMVREARAIGIDGWVRNRHDGTVEALIRAGDSQCQILIDACRKGPVFARVNSVQAARPEAETGLEKPRSPFDQIASV